MARWTTWVPPWPKERAESGDSGERFSRCAFRVPLSSLFEVAYAVQHDFSRGNGIQATRFQARLHSACIARASLKEALASLCEVRLRWADTDRTWEAAHALCSLRRRGSRAGRVGCSGAAAAADAPTVPKPRFPSSSSHIRTSAQKADFTGMEAPRKRLRRHEAGTQHGGRERSLEMSARATTGSSAIRPGS